MSHTHRPPHPHATAIAVVLAVLAGLLAAAPPALAAHTASTPREGATGPATAIRWPGSDRHDTAARIAVEFTSAGGPGPATAAVLASGSSFPDALAAGHLAGAVDGPVLLSASGRLSPATAARLAGEADTDLREVATVHVVGGPSAIGPQVVADLEALGVDVVRVAGADRVATAAAVASASGEPGTVDGQRTGLLARADAFPDAMAAGAVAAGRGLPLLLTPPDGLDARVAATLDALEVEHVIVLGGPAALGQAVVDDLSAAGVTTTRIGGADRAATAVALAEYAVDELGFDGRAVGLARGDDAADALALGAFAGDRRFPIVLAEAPDRLGTATADHLRTLDGCEVDTLYVPGGTAAVTDATVQAARQAMTCATAPTFDLLDATIADVHDAFAGRQLTADGTPLTCVELARAYVDRIDRLDDTTVTGLPISSVLDLAPSWEDDARALDAAHAAGGPSGPLHCVPVLLKDLFDTADAPTTAASQALLGSMPPDDAHTVARLRAAGALILGKTTMTEFAFFTQSHNSRTGRVGLPYDTTRDAGGSSNGTGAAITANFALVGTGSDTCASIRLPPSNAGLVGIRSTVGLVSQDGLIPLSHSLDVGGPMTRTVADAAVVLDAMAGVDAADPATADPERVQPPTYTDSLDPEGLDGARIGVLRSYGGTATFGHDESVDALVEQAIDDMAALGATVVDDVELPAFTDVSVDLITREAADHLDEYLASFDAPRGSTAEIAASGMVHPFIEALLLVALLDRDTVSADYAETVAQRDVMRTYVESEMDRLGLDALVYPPVHAPAQPTGTAQGDNCGFGSTASLPSIVVPAGMTEGTPSLPVGVEIAGRRWDEARLIELAYAYEQGTARRVRPVLPGDPVAEGGGGERTGGGR